MAEAVVTVTMETLRGLIIEEANFYFGVKSEVESMEQELRRMRSFLRDADSRQDSDDRVFNWVSEVREAAYDVEDSVLAYVVAKLASKRSRNSRNIFKKTSTFFKEIVVTYRVGSRISNIRTKIARLTHSLQTYGIKPVDLDSGSRVLSGKSYSRNRDLRRSYSHVVEEDFVGLEKDIEMLVEGLIDEQRDRVVSIYGMGGLGKTTIARKVYGHRVVRRHFDGFAWTCISQQWEKRDVMQGILIKLVPERRAEVLGMRDEELVKELHDVQLKKKCLVVLDDVWSGEVWESLKAAFPNVRAGSGSKMVLTTRKLEVVNVVNPSGFRYEPRCLTHEESWELLKKKAFPRGEAFRGGEFKFDPDMLELGKEMVGRCCGLPLAILVLGGLLITKYGMRDWQMVSENINSYLAKGRGVGQQQAVNDVFELSYHDLPYQFKQCFLYLANFPEDFEMEAEKLYQLWLAEGIISQDDKADGETMMDVAERSLAELAQRCMVQVNVKETAGGFKNCRLHDLMRDLCITKAQRENFTRVIDSRRESLASSNKRRRISVYLEPNVTKIGIASSEYHHIRSAFFYANDSGEDVLLRVKSDLCSFKLLRVLYLQGFCHLHHLPKAIGDLIHLKYLSLSASQFKKLPSSLGKLIYLQTLDLEVDKSLELEIPNVIWKMEQLQHLYLPSNFCVEGGAKLRLDGLNDLETLVNFNTSLCDVKDLDRLSNLRKLRAAIKDKLDDLPNIIKYISFTKNQLRRSSLSISCSKFCSDEELNLLRTLLGCHRLYKLSIGGRIARLPEHYHFSSSIAKIAFKASQLDDDPMATLEKLEKLSSLTLYECTYMGEKMVCSTDGFPRLLYLKLWGLHNLKTWRIDEGAMPKLTRLVIADCEKLEMLPDGLRFIATLQKLNVRGMRDDFKGRLRAESGEGVDYYKVRHVPDIKLD